MPKTNSRPPVQGAGAEPYPFALKVLLWGCVLFLCVAAPGRAQSADTLTLSLDDLPWNIVSLGSGPLAAGDTAEFSFHLGSASEPIQHAFAFQLTVGLSGKAEKAVVTPFSAGDSWFLGDGEHTDQSFIDPSGLAILHLQSLRADTDAVSGHGELLRFKLKVKEAVESPADLINTGGGLVLVDNVEMKNRHDRPLCPQWEMGPNPAHEQVRLQADVLAATTVDLMDMRGEVVESVWVSGKKLALELTGDLPEGIYILRMRGEDGCIETKRLVLKR